MKTTPKAIARDVYGWAKDAYSPDMREFPYPDAGLSVLAVALGDDEQDIAFQVVWTGGVKSPWRISTGQPMLAEQLASYGPFVLLGGAT